MCLSCNVFRSKGCKKVADNITSSDLAMNVSTDLQDTKSDMTKNAGDHSEKYSPIPFRLSSLGIISTPKRTKKFSLLSVPEIGNTNLTRL